MDDLAYLRPSILLKFLSSVAVAVAVAVAAEIDVIHQRRSYSRSLARSHCANIQTRGQWPFRPAAIRTIKDRQTVR